MCDFFVCFDLVFGTKTGIETPHEENEPAETQDQDSGLGPRGNPDLNVAALSERLKLNRQKDSRAGYMVVIS